ncbi:MAG TPA: ribosomal protein S18-alanine N-acetyltransferase [Terriglobales bacterium]|nr:ribosomal protein S18-alanine N-acetyltransferase [Terriglobales bacterium]
MKIRHGVTDDIPRMRELDIASPTGARWQVEHYRNLFRAASPTGTVLIAEAEGKVRGYLAASGEGAALELENIVVDPDVQRQGVASMLVAELLRRAEEMKVSLVELEVRESNASARRLYEKCGFAEVRRRPRYYSSPTEDAVIYRYMLTGSAQP